MGGRRSKGKDRQLARTRTRHNGLGGTQEASRRRRLHQPVRAAFGTDRAPHPPAGLNAFLIETPAVVSALIPIAILIAPPIAAPPVALIGTPIGCRLVYRRGAPPGEAQHVNGLSSTSHSLLSATPSPVTPPPATPLRADPLDGGLRTKGLLANGPPITFRLRASPPPDIPPPALLLMEGLRSRGLHCRRNS